MLKLLCLSALLVAAASAAATGQTAVGRRQFSDDDNNSLSEYIRQVLQNLKQAMPNGIPELNIPPLDPLNVPEINANIKQGIADINLHMKDLKVQGLSSFVVRDVQGDLSAMTFSLDLFMPEIEGVAQYDLDGKVLIFPLYGKGMAGLRVNDLHFQGSAKISIVDMEKVQLDHFDMHIVFSQIQLYLENIVGGGNLGNMVNMVMNMMGKLLYDRFKDQLLPVVNDIIRKALNEQLEKINLKDIIGGAMPAPTAFSVSVVQDSVNTYIDELMENLRPFLKANNVDPLPLPQVGASFSKKVLGIRWHGGVRVNSGHVFGLSSIHRVGNFDLKQDGNIMSVAGSVGVNNVRGNLHATAWFMRIRVSAGASIAVSSVRVRAGIAADMGGEAELLQLEQFGITHMSRISVRITGLSVLGWVLSPLANLIVNLVKGKIISAIEDPVRQQIINLLGSVQLPKFFALE